jgi:methionyl aminopeptidase
MDDQALGKYLEAGRIASKVREEARVSIKEGAYLLDIAEMVESRILELGGQLAFPVNISLDSQAAHYTPHSNDKLRFSAGNVVKLDLGVQVDGYIADTATTVEVASNKWGELIRASSLALEACIEAIKPGITTGDLGAIIETVIETHGFTPVSNLSGHLLERHNLHAGLSIPNVRDGSSGQLKEGMAVAIEPFATDGAGRVAGRKSGNIYRQIRVREHDRPEVNEVIGFIDKEFNGLPFSERSIAKGFRNSDKMLKKLLRFGVISTYPVLRDAKGGMVSQAEHTVIVTKSGCRVTTK